MLRPSHAPTTERPQAPWDAIQCQPGVLGLYESNYLRALSPDGRTALWLKHNLLAPQDPNEPALLELWAILHRRGQRPEVLWQRRPAAAVQLAAGPLHLEGRDVLLTQTRTATAVVQAANGMTPAAPETERTARWDLALTATEAPLGAPLIHFPDPRMYRWPLPKKKILTPAPHLHLNGWLLWKGERIDVRGWLGMRNHNWGTEHAHLYAYANCNSWDGAEGWILDGLSARLKVAGLVLPPLSLAVLRTPDGDRPFNALGRALRVKVEIAFPHWRAQFGQDGQRLTLDISGNPGEFAALRYHHPGGAVSYCYNTKFAQAELTLDGRRLHSDRAELEFACHQPLPGIDVQGP